jgi:hypothetical protein
VNIVLWRPASVKAARPGNLQRAFIANYDEAMRRLPEYVMNCGFLSGGWVAALRFGLYQYLSLPELRSRWLRGLGHDPDET